MPRAASPAPPAATLAAPTPTAAMTPNMAPAPAMGSGFAIPPGAPPPKLGSVEAAFEQTGMADKFNGRVESCWYCLRKYKTGKKAETYRLFFEINIRADDRTLGVDGLVTEYLGVDDLRQWVPSRTDPIWNGTQWVYTPAGSISGQPVTLDMAIPVNGQPMNIWAALAEGLSGFPSGKLKADGVTADTAMMAPDDWKGWYAIPGISNSHDNFAAQTKFEHFKKELEKTGYKARAPHINWADMRQFLVGVYGFWVRLPYSFKGEGEGAAGIGGGQPGGGQPDGQGRKPIDPLCLGQIIDLGPISGAGPGPSPAVAAQSLSMPAPTPVPAPAPVPAAVPVPAQPVQMAMPGTPVAQVAPMPATTPASATPDAIAQAQALTNQILTEMVASNPGGLTKQQVGDIVFQRAGMYGLGCLNDANWMVGDDRTFAFNPEKGLILPLPASA